jgi:hypothetical protein
LLKNIPKADPFLNLPIGAGSSLRHKPLSSGKVVIRACMIGFDM